ncbi:MAG: SoxR reducing system RseC family protein [Peptoniphilaceae bacterium]|nr:SoxR reducing system RseC family protein [Peptoniphilaceae bacterium]MDD7383459.1 SoxR reducing system RseC family protein [Peptoniphilaceae bacterium]MDY3738478.1 SoxR reducing system RseC family protein [Peptoniphilaceae bacterium]
MSIIKKTGIVVSNVNGNVRIMLQKDSGCGSCSTCGGCDIKPVFFTTEDYPDLKVGDKVVLESENRKIVFSTWKMYVMPVIMILIGAVIPNVFLAGKGFDMNVLTFLSVLIFLAISLLILNKIDKKFNSNEIIKIKECVE